MTGRSCKTVCLAVLLAVALAAGSGVGCRTRLVISDFALRGIRLGMIEEEVHAVLGPPESTVLGYFTWQSFAAGTIVCLRREWPEEPRRVVWVVQTEGACSPGLAVGRPQEVVVARSGQEAFEENGRPRVRFQNEAGDTLDVVFDGAKVAFFALYQPSDTLPVPDPEFLPRFELGGVRLLMEASAAVDLLGAPDEVKQVDCWESWRYHERGLTVNVAAFPQDPDRTPRVTWVMQTKGAYAPHFELGDSGHRAKRLFAHGGFSTLRNDQGHNLALRTSSGVKDAEYVVLALILALDWDPVVDRGEEPLTVAEVFPLKLAGIGYGMTMPEVEQVLGPPDIVIGGWKYACPEWEYFERDLSVYFSHPEDHPTPYVWKVSQDRGTWMGLAVGDPEDVVRRRLEGLDTRIDPINTCAIQLLDENGLAIHIAIHERLDRFHLGFPSDH